MVSKILSASTHSMTLHSASCVSLFPSFPFLSVSLLLPHSPSTLLGSGSVFNLQAILSLLAIPAVLYILVLKTVVGVPGGVFNSMFTITNMEKFELTPTTNGYLLGYMGVISMVSYLAVILKLYTFILLHLSTVCLSFSLTHHTHHTMHTHTHTQLVQAFGVGFFSKRYSDNVVLLASIFTMTFSYLFLVCNYFLLFQGFNRYTLSPFCLSCTHRPLPTTLSS